jgi:exopolyphosphatase/guanosine-5'-triphosphate,3'-diphosphate pyrophosphatase
MDTPRPAATLAAIDVGSNTVHLVVARPATVGRDLLTLADEVVLVRLGADVTATGAIGPERAARAMAAVRRQAEVAHGLGAAAILGLATEGVRAARNSADFVDQIRGGTGVELALISGEQEAALTFWGATSGHALEGRRAVVDLGGGSLELVVGYGAQISWRVSLPLGSGVVHDRLAPTDPPVAAELAAAERTVDQALAALAPPLPVDEAVACGGSATTLAVLAQRALGTWVEASQVGMGTGASARELPALTDELLARLIGLLETLPAAEVARLYQVEEERARLLAVGAVVLRAALRLLRKDALCVSLRGIREGAIMAYLEHGAGWLEAAAQG